MAEHQQPFGSGAGEPASIEDDEAAARIANRFDIRRIIGGLMVLYAVILIVAGVVGSDTVKNKAAGINVDLWTGLAMLVVGVLMIVWALTRPVAELPSSRRRSAAA